MAVKINNKAKSFLSGLISANKINEAAWSFNAADGNVLLGTDGNDWDAFGKVHLAVNDEFESGTKNHYMFPVAKKVGDSIEIFRRGVIAAKSVASGGRGAPDRPEVASVADSLLQAIDKKLGKEDKYDQLRIDYISTDAANLDSVVEKTDEGFIRGRSVVTNVGVFPYRMADGSIHYELRPPEEVFHPESLDSLKMAPVTNNHPEVAVGASTIKDVQVGSLGDAIITDAFHVSVPWIITDQATIMDVNNGKRAWSCGYSADIEETPGRWMGVAYDAIQRNIRYNHAAVVDSGRAGDAARIRMDSINTNIGVMDIQNKKQEDTVNNLKTVKIDGVDYDAEANVVAAYTKSIQDAEQLRKDSEQLIKDKASIEAERDQFKDENEKLKKDMEEMKDKMPANLESIVRERMVLLDAAKRTGIEITDEMLKSDTFDADTKKAVIVKLFPSAKEKIDGLDATKVEGTAYLSARFDTALESLDTYEANNESTNNTLIADSIGQGSTKKNLVNDSYKKMVQDMQTMWLPKKEEVN